MIRKRLRIPPRVSLIPTPGAWSLPSAVRQKGTAAKPQSPRTPSACLRTVVLLFTKERNTLYACSPLRHFGDSVSVVTLVLKYIYLFIYDEIGCRSILRLHFWGPDITPEYGIILPPLRKSLKTSKFKKSL